MIPSTISRQDLLDQYDTFLFDADGTLWWNFQVIPGAVSFINTLLEANKKVFIVTNNSSKTREQYVEKMVELGFGRIPKEHIISPAVVLVDYFRSDSKYHQQHVYIIGSEELEEILEEEGNILCLKNHHEEEQENNNVRKPSAVVCGYDLDFCQRRIENAVQYLKDPEVDFLVTCQDMKTPEVREEISEAERKCIATQLKRILGRPPVFFGKPDEHIGNYLKKHHVFDASRTVMFGDRLDTDMHFAHRNGFTGCLVLTGEHSLDDIKEKHEEGSHHMIPHYITHFHEEQVSDVV